MGLETATYVKDLVPTNPTSSDFVSQGDDHIRMLKSVLQSTFPSLCGPGLATVGGTANAITLTYSTAPGSNLPGEIIYFTPTAANTGATTISVNGNAALSLYNQGAALVGGELQPGVTYQAMIGANGAFNLIANGSLPLTGGTLTGNLNGTSATFSAALAASSMSVNNGTFIVNKGSATNPAIYFNDGTTNRSAFYFEIATGRTTMLDLHSGAGLYLDPTGNLTYNAGTGVAYKTGGGSWTAPSDARIKTVEADYKQGLDEVLKLRPVVYRYKGNDSFTADEPSMHKAAADAGKPFIGLIAQEVEPVMPEMVSSRAGFIDGKPVQDLRDINTSALIYALVNAVKTLTARVEALETQLAGA